MLSDDAVLSPLASIEAKIQNRIVAFLALKDTIQKLAKSKSPIVAQQAASLWTRQKELESELSDALAKIENLKQGAWTFSDIADLTTFYIKMETQIGDVRALEKQDAGVAPTTGTDWVSWLPWVVIGVGGYFMIKALTSGRR